MLYGQITQTYKHNYYDPLLLRHQ